MKNINSPSRGSGAYDKEYVNTTIDLPFSWLVHSGFQSHPLRHPCPLTRHIWALTAPTAVLQSHFQHSKGVTQLLLDLDLAFSENLIYLSNISQTLWHQGLSPAPLRAFKYPSHEILPPFFFTSFSLLPDSCTLSNPWHRPGSAHGARWAAQSIPAPGMSNLECWSSAALEKK